MVWYSQATSHHRRQQCPRSMSPSPYGATRPHWVNLILGIIWKKLCLCSVTTREVTMQRSVIVTVNTCGTALLTHKGRDEMTAISQTFSSAFPWTETFEFWLNFRWIVLYMLPYYQIDNMAALVQIMPWYRTGDKPLSEPMLIRCTDAYIRHSAPMSSTHWSWDKMATICRQYFRINFLNWKYLGFGSWGSKWHCISIGSGNGSIPTRYQTATWSNGDGVQRRICFTSLDELKSHN